LEHGRLRRGPVGILLYVDGGCSRLARTCVPLRNHYGKNGAGYEEPAPMAESIAGGYASFTRLFTSVVRPVALLDVTK